MVGWPDCLGCWIKILFSNRMESSVLCIGIFAQALASCCFFYFMLVDHILPEGVMVGCPVSIPCCLKLRFSF